MMRLTCALLALAVLPGVLRGQQEGPTATETIVRVEGKAAAALLDTALSIEVNGKPTKVTSLRPLPADGVQIALLIDDGLRSSAGRQLDDLKKFIQGLPQGTAIFVGYMQNGRVVPAQNFTTDHTAAAASLRIPLGAAGISASPYICISDFTKHLPRETESYGTPASSGHQATFILMLTNGVDPYNGSVSPLNQNSPYVDAAATDAQRAGIPVYAIYYSDAGIGGGLANFSGQSYLAEVAEKTGGVSLYNGRINPVALLPYLEQFQQAMRESYIAAFEAPSRKDLLPLRVRSSDRGVKVHAAQSVHSGMVFGTAGAAAGSR